MPRPKPLDWLVLAGLVIAWGSAFGALKIAVQDISPVWNTVIRLWVASGTLAVVCLMNRAALPPLLPRPHVAWGYYAVIGTIGLAAPFYLFAFAAKGIPSAVNAICNGASPIFTAALALAVLREEQLGALASTAVAVVYEPPMTAWPSPASTAAVVSLGVFPTALAGIGYVFLVQRQGPVFMSMAIYLAPLWATALGVLLLGERPGWPAYAALALILGGVALATTTRKA